MKWISHYFHFEQKNIQLVSIERYREKTVALAWRWQSVPAADRLAKEVDISFLLSPTFSQSLGITFVIATGRPNGLANTCENIVIGDVNEIVRSVLKFPCLCSCWVCVSVSAAG